MKWKTRVEIVAVQRLGAVLISAFHRHSELLLSGNYVCFNVDLWLLGDVNFAPELSDLRYRHHLRVILIHTHQATDALRSCAHERYNFLELFADVTDRRLDEV